MFKVWLQCRGIAANGMFNIECNAANALLCAFIGVVSDQ